MNQAVNPVAIVCVRNCRGRPNAHEAIALKVTSSLLTIVSTEWSVTPDINWKRDTGSGNRRQFLSIYENTLQAGTTYDVTAIVKIRHGPTRTRTFKISKPLHMATPPTLGTCFVTPTKGVFLQDKFAVNCSGFIDLIPPLTYMFYLDPKEYTTSPHGLLQHISVGKPRMPPMMLPTKYQHNYTATIRIVVGEGLAASNFVEVKFELLRFANKGTEEIRKMDELLNSLGGVDVHDALGLVYCALAILRNAPTEAEELAPKWLNIITHFLTGIKDTHATIVRLKANVLKDIIATSINSTADTKVAAAGLLEKMAKNVQLFQKDDSDNWESPESKPVHIKEAAKAIYEGCLRMIDMETQNVTPDNIQSVKELSMQLIRTIDIIASTLINLMVPGSRTTVIKLGDDVMLLKKGLVYLIGRQTFSLPPISGDGRGVSLALTEAVAEDDESGMNFGMAVLRMTRNPYVWSTSSRYIIPGVVFINHYQTFGSARHMKELKRNITIAFPVSTKDETNGTAIVRVSYMKNRDEVFEDDLITVALPVLSNKRYHIKMFATAKVTLVLVVKAYTNPNCWDFYGGDRISKNATIFVVDFARTTLPRRFQTSTSPGLEHLIVDVNATTVTLVGTLHSKEERVMLYIGLMPAVYDTMLCKRCSGNSINPCGFCSGKMGTSADTELDVKVTVVRYVADCVFWNSQEEKWSNEGCEFYQLVCNIDYPK
ncbi:hypothetical protein LSAT2_011410 [Lamellibrachia satsuma]|nr:hypothetical protein LSAT2_011410 [Lamellibrachia satsuma]